MHGSLRRFNRIHSRGESQLCTGQTIKRDNLAVSAVSRKSSAMTVSGYFPSTYFIFLSLCIFFTFASSLPSRVPHNVFSLSHFSFFHFFPSFLHLLLLLLLLFLLLRLHHHLLLLLFTSPLTATINRQVTVGLSHGGRVYQINSQSSLRFMRSWARLMQ